jgi:hypothetical protein
MDPSGSLPVAGFMDYSKFDFGSASGSGSGGESAPRLGMGGFSAVSGTTAGGRPGSGGNGAGASGARAAADGTAGLASRWAGGVKAEGGDIRNGAPPAVGSSREKEKGGNTEEEGEAGRENGDSTAGSAGTGEPK